MLKPLVIRRTQMAAFRQAQREALELRLLHYLRHVDPSQTQLSSDDELQALVRFASAHARSFRLDRESELAELLGILVALPRQLRTRRLPDAALGLILSEAPADVRLGRLRAWAQALAEPSP